MRIRTVGSNHQVGLPSLNWLDCDITRHTCLLSLVFTRMLIQKSNRVHIIVDRHILIIGTITIIDRLGRITHDSLTINLSTGSIYRTVFMILLHNIELQLHDVVEHIMRQTCIETHFIRISLQENTLLVSISEISIIRGCLVTTSNRNIMIVGECSTCYSIQPICIVSLVCKVGQTISDIRAIHHIKLIGK